jgi:hypothetical protein
MGPQAIIVGGILAKDPAQMSLSEHDQVVDTFPSDHADQSSSVLTGGGNAPTPTLQCQDRRKPARCQRTTKMMTIVRPEGVEIYNRRSGVKVDKFNRH